MGKLNVLSVLFLVVAGVALFEFRPWYHKNEMKRSTDGYYTLVDFIKGDDKSFHASLKWVPGENFADY